jgi:AcrR family transcriptional regulator
MAADGRGPRADARRNRERVLRVAAEIFAAEGLSVPVHEIARRAGVGTGTVSRHFPSKVDLFAAILLGRVEELDARAARLAADLPPGAAFEAMFRTVVRAGAAHRGLAEALAGAGYDVERAAALAGHDLTARVRGMLARAQESGAVRPDVQYADVKALMTGCLARDTGDDPGALDRIIDLVCSAMRATTGPPPPASPS